LLWIAWTRAALHPAAGELGVLEGSACEVGWKLAGVRSLCVSSGDQGCVSGKDAWIEGGSVASEGDEGGRLNVCWLACAEGASLGSESGGDGWWRFARPPLCRLELSDGRAVGIGTGIGGSACEGCMKLEEVRCCVWCWMDRCIGEASLRSLGEDGPPIAGKGITLVRNG
jgi:hypothetical protein